MKIWERYIYLILLVLVLALAGWITSGFHKEVSRIREVQEIENTRHTETKEFLLSTIDWSTQRQKTILFMRDMIVDEWQRIGTDKLDFEKAYRKAECIQNESEKYPDVNPLFMLAIQYCESRFLDTLVSVKGAIGSWQLMPTTARLLCDAMNMSYAVKYLRDPAASTKLAGKLIGILQAEYGDEDIVAADYNGGPWQAYYARSERNRLVKETADFIVCVKTKKNEYTEAFSKYKIDEKFIHKK